jgi:hypothetical protein
LAVALVAHDDRVQLIAIKGGDQIAGGGDAHFEDHQGVIGGQAAEPRRQVGAGHVVADADHQAPQQGVAHIGQGAFMGIEQGAGGDDELFAAGRQPHMPTFE